MNMNCELKSAIQEKIDNLNKPKGSLGVLEDIAMQVALIQGTLTPELRHPAHILFGGDHGIEREGVSLSPREVTWQQMINYGHGGGGVNVFCRQHGFSLRIVDVGVDYDFDPVRHAHIIPRKIGYGTRNFLHEAAMTATEWEQALAVGREQVDACYAEGSNVLCLGEMGIGNTSPSSVLMHLFLDIALPQCVGAGSGLDSAGVSHKLSVLTQAVAHYRAVCEGFTVADTIRYFVGYEMAAAIGAMLRAAELRMVILVDGFIMTACMLAAEQLNPAVRECAIFGHCGDEGGHHLMLSAMHAQPLLSLGMRLGEGTGALCAYPIVDSAVRMLNEMNNFENAKITKYF
ncbi:MAG: nicotinate-nucleotide--dimethylbenzimidazole phosphoribosyltransferase [Bacteroidaceae bacterium]|nr:nicotinate-nucleotide--dimethylbenzimidazole phosphoribosyltransferase [Bacteroidaceae bacterium]